MYQNKKKNFFRVLLNGIELEQLLPEIRLNNN